MSKGMEAQVNEFLEQLHEVCDGDLVQVVKLLEMIQSHVIIRAMERKKELEEHCNDLMREANKLAEIIPDDVV